MELAGLADCVVQGQHSGITVLEAIVSDLNDTKIILISNNVPYGDCLLILEHIPLPP